MKRIVTVLAVMALLLVPAGTALAAEDAATDAPERHRDYGALWAKGEGHVELDVERAKLGMKVSGDVTIIGPASLEVHIDGVRSNDLESNADVVIALDDFTGRIGIVGTDFTVEVDGKVALKGKGSGSASFLGKGWWKTLHKRGLWPADVPLTMVFGGETDANVLN